jgi:hypothetical protein
MIAGACETARECIPELALGRVDGAERAEVLLHVHGCARCQAILDEHSGVADLLAQLAPEVEPPAGFDRRVLRAMRPSTGREWRSIRRRALVVGGAAAAAAILSLTIVRVVDANRVSEQASAPASALRTAPMVGNGGLPVGRVVVSAGNPASAVVTINYALPDGAYELQLTADDGTVTRGVGTVEVTAGRGAWKGSLAIPAKGGVLAMVDAAGAPVCHARLHSV